MSTSLGGEGLLYLGALQHAAYMPAQFHFNSGSLLPSAFSVQLLVLSLLAQLTQLAGLRSTTDITFDSWPFYISNQLVLNLSLV